MKKATLTALLAASILSGCGFESISNLFGGKITQEALQQNSWQLESINGQVLSKAQAMMPATLSINENFQVAGYNGCNSYFGTGELNSNQFKIMNMGSTKKACSPEETEIEKAMTQVLTGSSKISLKDQKLTLKNDTNTLVFIVQ